jgi:hypothetical protein
LRIRYLVSHFLGLARLLSILLLRNPFAALIGIREWMPWLLIKIRVAPSSARLLLVLHLLVASFLHRFQPHSSPQPCPTSPRQTRIAGNWKKTPRSDSTPPKFNHHKGNSSALKATNNHTKVEAQSPPRHSQSPRLPTGLPRRLAPTAPALLPRRRRRRWTSVFLQRTKRAALGCDA